MQYRNNYYICREVLSRFSSKRKIQALGVLVLVFATAGVEMVVAGAVSAFGLALSSPEKLYSNKIVATLFDFFKFDNVELSNASVLGGVLFVVFLAVIIKNIFLAVLTYCQARFSYSFSYSMGAELLKSYLRMPYVWHLNQNTGELVAVVQYRNTMSRFINNMLLAITQVVSAVVLVVGGLLITPEPMLIMLGMMGVLGLLGYSCARKQVHNHSKILEKTNRRISMTVLTTLQGVREIFIYNQRSKSIDNFCKLAAVQNQSQAPVLVFSSFTFWVLEAGGMLTLFVVFCYMYLSGMPYAQILSSLALMAGIAWRLLPCTNKLSTAMVKMNNLAPYSSAFLEKLSLHADHARDREEAMREGEALVSDSPFEELSLSHVGFTYPNQSVESLSDVSLSISRGQKVGIIGASGAGKSTLIGLLTGLLVPSSGDVFFNGAVCTKSLAKGHAVFGYVPQTPYLLDASLAENIAFSNWQGVISTERVRECCKLAAIDFVDALPEKLETKLGERGARLSGGQIQRVAIARALYSRPDIVFFDEATSALDVKSESSILKTIDDLGRSMTVVIVAHRLSTVQECDVLYWLDNGKIVASGSPDEVINTYKQHCEREII
ncbi:ABC transporter ATP-binding protein/permease [Desulfovibrio mangrovi]|uniref:ABC transporter ATP-binding protein n=1 Tax=Desulfovibrio mangrovi TaxID=2976983 RepID=UPI002246A042|nr:ABC transporter ATP-binding protein [Desulfovibrio mangrovi]UZP66667.1 ABC transporter ATP-binding protein/permease [Desulfovibrio mangrovi]